MTECEVPQFYQHSEPVARKRHECCECDAPIEIGEKHFKATGKWECWGVRTYRQHFDCMLACMLIRDELNDYECIGFGMLKESFGEIKVGWMEIGSTKETRHPAYQRLRDLMAKIIRRERNSSW